MTERAKKLLLLYYEQSKKNRTIQGSPPLTFKGKGKDLKNYRIYGNTVNGESVGDLITEGEHAGEYSVTVTVTNGTDTETTNIYLPEQIKMVGDEAEYIDFGEQKLHRVRKNLFDINMITANAFINVTTGNVIASSTANANVSDFIPVLSGENYFFSFDAELQAGFTFVIAYYDEDKTYLQTKSNYTSSSNVYHYQLAFTPTNNGFIRIKYSSNSINMQLEKGSTATPYEPYIADTELDVTLPTLPTLSGTNTLSVSTEIQPSGVEIKGRIKAVQEGGA